jgi:hypothetical protein
MDIALAHWPAMAAAITPDNTPGGYILTFAVPVGLFVVVAVVLYLLLARPHRRSPVRRVEPLAAGRPAPDPDAARAASIAGGLALAAGSGSAESHLEPAGHAYATEADPAAAPDDAVPPAGEAPGAGGAAPGSTATDTTGDGQ